MVWVLFSLIKLNYTVDILLLDFLFPTFLSFLPHTVHRIQWPYYFSNIKIIINVNQEEDEIWSISDLANGSRLYDWGSDCLWFKDFSDYWGNMKNTEKSSDQFNSVETDKSWRVYCVSGKYVWLIMLLTFNPKKLGTTNESGSLGTLLHHLLNSMLI